jgi:lipoteichoic acid synthase
MKYVRSLNSYQLAFGMFLLLFIKTYIVSRFVFDLPVQNQVEEIIVVINSFAAISLLFTVISLTSKRKERLLRRFLIADIIATLLLYSNIVYYRFFNDFITVPVIFQFKNFSQLGGSAVGLMRPWDWLLFVDLIIAAVILVGLKTRAIDFNKKKKSGLLFASIVLLVVNLGLAETQRPQLLTRIFDREMVVKYLGIYNYHLFDMYVTSKSSAQRTFAEGSDIVEVENYVNHPLNNENEFTGIAKDKNLILISMESLQNFLIDYKVNGQEVTPFLNDLIDDSYYFNNFYHQTGQGKTSDSEFLIDNSLYPLSRGAVFTTNAQNEYIALPEILNANGYTTSAFHGNNKSFWNRDLMYKTLGYDHYFSEEYYQVSKENSINYGLMDIPFFQQSIPLMQQLEQPFHAKFITLTHHYPYLLPEEEEQAFPALETGDGSVDRYVQTANYFDKSLKIFFDELKRAGLYEDSIFILYGDHYGISENHKPAMEKVIGKEITPYEQLQLQKVPLIVHIPGEDGKTISSVSGQIDLKPTILNLLGIQIGNDIQFGSDLFDPSHREFAVQRDGSFVTEHYAYTSGLCYDRETGVEIDAEFCEPGIEKAERELYLSDKVIQSDLLRFLEKRE